MENKFICPLPWVSLSIGVNNKRRLCCHEIAQNMEMSQKDIEEIKELMLNDAVPLNCKKCASLEENNISSPRHQYLKEFSDLSSVKYLDLVLNNDCNLECLMCSPAYSVKLNTIYKEIFPEETLPSWRINIDELLKNDLSQVEVINIIGGEPLLSRDSRFLLDSFLRKKRLKKLRLVTNMTKLPDHWKSIFEQVEELEIIASVDATEKLYEFIRYPATFEAITKTLEKLHSWKLKNLKLTQHVVLMNLNFPYLKEILEFHEKYFSSPEKRLPIFVEISSPQVLHPRVLTKGQWERAREDALNALSVLEDKYGQLNEFLDFKNLIRKMEKTNLEHFYIDYQIYLQKIKKYHS